MLVYRFILLIRTSEADMYVKEVAACLWKSLSSVVQAFRRDISESRVPCWEGINGD